MKTAGAGATLSPLIHLIDDDEAVRRSLGLLLLSRGHAVQTFGSGEDFLGSAQLQRPGCVILDLRMGGLSGLQVFDALRDLMTPPEPAKRPIGFVTTDDKGNKGKTRSKP